MFPATWVCSVQYTEAGGERGKYYVQIPVRTMFPRVEEDGLNTNLKLNVDHIFPAQAYS
jgi:hypothetical protein